MGVLGLRAIASWKMFAVGGAMWLASLGATYSLGYTNGHAAGSEKAYARIVNDLQVDLVEARRFHNAAIREAQRQIDQTVNEMQSAIAATNARALEAVRQQAAQAEERARRAEREKARLQIALAHRPDPALGDWGIDAAFVRELNAATAAVARGNFDDPENDPPHPLRTPDPMPAVPSADPRASRGPEARSGERVGDASPGLERGIR